MSSESTTSVAAAVRGFFPPRTATGRASLIPSPPWYYSGDLLTVEYRTDPARVRELLPEPLVPAAEDPGAVALIWADWQSCGAGKEELLDPVRSQYKECFAVVRCGYRGRTYSRCVHIWVDKDFALARGIHQGYPKKLGSIHLTRPHPYGPAPRIEPGAVFGATLAAGDRRLAQVVATLREPSATGGFVNAHPMAHHRVLPSIDGTGLALDELVESGAASFQGGQAWAADAELDLFESPTEELAALAVVEPIGAYYRQVGVCWDGGTVLQRGAGAPGGAGMSEGAGA
ncbi:acetoacetate decarboxylase family protein [Streptomyces sp. NPDC045456]|uniref:acetoacetate decarboxylase family protein n=1 Tax=Streptomyces sp. NPDC045456 TaxID=3155254 RepID=UPI0033D1E957